MDPLYFAYGSNLSQARMASRVPSAIARGAAWLDDYRLTLDKRSRDGSGKANLRAAPGERVHGALYRFDPLHWEALDACEPGYRRVGLRVATHAGSVAASTYISVDFTPVPLAYEWYKQLIVDGAAEHALPADWQRLLLSLPTKPHPSNPND